MSTATIEEEIVDVSVRLNQAMRRRQQFPEIISSCIALNFHGGLSSYFKTASSFVSFTWLFTGVSEGKILLPS